MNWGRGIAATLALSVCFAGCGASNSGGTLSRAALTSLANAICTTATRAGKTAEPPHSIHSRAAAARYLSRLAPISARETRSLAALHPASDVKPAWEAFLGKQLAYDRIVQSLSRRSSGNVPGIVGALSAVGPASQAVVDAASALGADACAK